MNVMVIVCLLIGVLLLISGIIFFLLKEKSVGLIAGFNSLSQDEQHQYDTLTLSIDVRNQLFRWSILLFLGGVLSFFSDYFGVATMFVWYLLLINNMGSDSFEKYKIKQ
ncbi:DUF3784 domain-containing protein [Vagococcus bubulae]|uniref:DUF3784 domain-containing protein n=1 Tax=Vagococcus bubulae TaxID=1977868 RepID=A0A429ZQF3_9ENTE|nr:DUF3784 domain-containing protein [Vagococcus bubulae]RST95888.1 hypothetical protein CBF36_01590 [Vagococcus bubulae]